MFNSYFKIIGKYHKIVTLGIFLICFVLSLGAQDIKLSASFRTFFEKNNPQILAFDEVENEFSKQDNLVFYIEPKNGNVYTKETLSLIHDLTDDSWKIPYAMRVSSVTNFQHTAVNGDDLTTNYLLDDKSKLETPSYIDFIKKSSINEPRLTNIAVDPKGSVATVLVYMNVAEGDTQASLSVTEKAEAMAKQYMAKYPNVKVMVGGTIAWNSALHNVFGQDLTKLGIISYLVIIVVFLSLVRTVSALFITLGVITMSISTTFGVFNLLGVTLSPIHTIVPTAIMSIAIADVIHIITSYYVSCQHHDYKLHALRETMRINFQAVFITSFTTFVGVLTMITCEAKPYRILGEMIAMGVALAWVLAVTFVPAVLAWLPKPSYKVQQTNRTIQRVMEKSPAFVFKYKRQLVWGFLATMFFAFLTLPKMTISESWYRYFDKTYAIRQVMENFDKKLAGIHVVQYVVRGQGGTNSIYSPEYLSQLEKFAAWYGSQPEVGHVEVLSDVIKQLNQTLHHDDKTFYKIPESKEATAQYFLLYEMSLPFGLGLDNIQNSDRSATRMQVTLHSLNSQQILAVDARAEAWVKAHAPALKISEGTGMDIIFSHSIMRDIVNIASSSIAGIFIISIILMFTFRSFWIGLISLIPNLVPIAVAYGIWSLIDGEISVAVAVVICLSMGIVVDDTIHFITKYLRARREYHFSKEDAVEYAFKTVGSAMVATTVILCSGFMVLTFAHFTPSVFFGLLMSLTLFIAVVADLYMLPPLLLLLDNKVYDTTERRFMSDRRMFDVPLASGQADRRKGDRRSRESMADSKVVVADVAVTTNNEESVTT